MLTKFSTGIVNFSEQLDKIQLDFSHVSKTSRGAYYKNYCSRKKTQVINKVAIMKEESIDQYVLCRA